MANQVQAYQAHQAANQPNPRPPAATEPQGQSGTVPPGGPNPNGKPDFPAGSAPLPKRRS